MLIVPRDSFGNA